MPTLKEIKGRIASVSSTLKITSAMKMVASAKLRKAQKAMGMMLPYQQLLFRILSDLVGERNVSSVVLRDAALSGQEEGSPAGKSLSSVALVCFASNSSLCGGFNANAVRKAVAALEEYRAKGVQVTVFSIGRKMADAMRKRGFPSPRDYTALAAEPDYAGIAALGEELVTGYRSGRFDRVDLIYNHFKSTASQPTVREAYLPLGEKSIRQTLEFQIPDQAGEEAGAAGADGENVRNEEVEFIVEPDKKEAVALLLPKVLSLKIYAVLLDTVAAEHAARTVAMQIATDNAEDLLDELTLEYNKGRQQKITAEILDLEGGALE